jgi:hypothetical protein
MSCGTVYMKDGKKPHKWAKEIKAWADGYEVEHNFNPDVPHWITLHPASVIDWNYPQVQFRIKPSTIDVYQYLYYAGGRWWITDNRYASVEEVKGTFCSAYYEGYRPVLESKKTIERID